MRFKNETGIIEVEVAIDLVEFLLRPNSPMIQELRAKNDWRFNSGTGERVVEQLLKERRPLSVRLYDPGARSSAVGAYTPGQIVMYISFRKVSNENILPIAGTLLHEFSHYCGFHHNSWVRWTNNFRTDEKVKYSVPYYLSENIGRWGLEVVDEVYRS